MIYGLRMLPAAERDVDEIARFIARDRMEAALRFYDAVQGTTDQIREYPVRSRRYENQGVDLKNIRVCPVKGYADFLIFYRVDADMVEILRVIHGARDIPAIFEPYGTPGAE